MAASSSTATMIKLIVSGNMPPIKVSKDVLIDCSLVFKNIIVEHYQSSIDLTDFTYNAANVFICSIRSQTAPGIHNEYFRDLNKMGYVFSVGLVIRSCASYLKELLFKAVLERNFWDCVFVINEALFISEKLKSDIMLDFCIITITRQCDFCLTFVTKYFAINLHEKTETELNMLLKLCFMQPFLVIRILHNQLITSPTFYKNIQYLLKHINFRLCVAAEFDLSYKMFESVRNLPALPHKDCLFLWKLQTDASKDYFRYATKSTSNEEDNAEEIICKCQIDLKTNLTQSALLTGHCNDDIDTILEHISKVVALYPPMNKTAFMIIYLLNLAVWKPAVINSPETLVKKLEAIASNNSWHPINSDLVDMLVQHELSGHLKPIEFLEEILKSDILSSYFKSVRVDCDTLARISLELTMKKQINKLNSGNKAQMDLHLKVKEFTKHSYKYPFKFPHPHSSCRLKDSSCGFLVKVVPVKEGCQLQLVTDTSQYPDYLHFHKEIIRSEDILCILECSGSDYRYYLGCWEGSTKVCVHQPDSDTVDRIIVFYNISDHMMLINLDSDDRQLGTNQFCSHGDHMARSTLVRHTTRITSFEHLIDNSSQK